MLKHKLFLVAFASAFFFQFSHAAEVIKVKGDAILIDTAGDEIKMGSTYYLMAGDKKKGIVKILKLRPGQALGKLLKGKALSSWVLKKRVLKAKKKAIVKKKKPKAPAPKSIYSKKGKRNRISKRRKRRKSNDSKLAIGVAIGMNNNNSDVVFTNPARTDSYAGSSTSFELLADYQMYNKFHIRGSLGLQNFEAGGDPTNTQCIGSDNQIGQICQIELGYMNLDIWLRYKALEFKKVDFWAGAGLGILFSPQYNSTTALSEEDLATTTFMQVGGGMDIRFTDKLYAPVWVEYGLFPSSDTVDMNSFSFYFGLAYQL